jgi:predicted O-methyltransferase YrrM
MDYDHYKYLANLSNCPVLYEGCYNGSLKMRDHKFPISIKLNEFNFLKDFIIKCRLRRGYEIATAFGVSALGIGLAMSKTGGKLVTMDSYIEERSKVPAPYVASNDLYEKSDGFKSVNFLVDHFHLKDHVFPKVGWSPTDTFDKICEVFDITQERLDFVFIDAAHDDDSVIRDIDSIKDFIADKFVIFFHDMDCFSPRGSSYIEQTFKGKLKYPPSCQPPGGYHLAYITNLE